MSTSTRRQLARRSPPAAPPGRAGRTRPADIRDRSPARSGTGRGAWPPPAATAPSAAAARAACACPGRRAAAAGRGRRSPGSGRRRAPSGQLADHQVLHLVGLDQHQLGAGGSSASGRRTMSVVRPDASDSRPKAVAIRALSASPQAACTRPRTATGCTPASRRSRPGSAPPRSSVGGHDAGGLALVAQVRHRLVGGALVQVVVLATSAGSGPRRLAENSPSACPSSRGVRPVAPPEGHRPRGAGGGGHDHAVVRDLLTRQIVAPSKNVGPARVSRPSLRPARRRGGRRPGARRTARGRGWCRR